MKRNFIRLAALYFVWNSVACVSMSSLQTAETLEKGKTQTTLGGGYYSSQEKLGSTTLDTKVPYLEYSYREGLRENLDAGFKLTIIGSAAADVKYRLVDGDAFDFSVGGALGYMNVSSGSGATKIDNTIIDFMVPAYASYRFSPTLAAYATPRYVLRMNSRSGADSGTSTASLLGGAGGMKVGNSWGAYLEAAYQKQMGSDFDLMQYNVSFFWESDGGFLSQFF